MSLFIYSFLSSVPNFSSYLDELGTARRKNLPDPEPYTKFKSKSKHRVTFERPQIAH